VPTCPSFSSFAIWLGIPWASWMAAHNLLQYMQIIRSATYLRSDLRGVSMFTHIVLENDQISIRKGCQLVPVSQPLPWFAFTLGFLDGSTKHPAIHANHPPHTECPSSICKWYQLLNMHGSVDLVLLGWQHITSCSTCESFVTYSRSDLHLQGGLTSQPQC